MGLPCVSPSHVLALDLVCFLFWVVFLFVLGWDKHGEHGAWDGMRKHVGCFFVVCVGVAP
jgi:hypothetical protein